MAKEDKPKRRKIPPRTKPPRQPFRDDQGARPSVSLSHERLVGRVAIEWARLEACIGDLISSLVGLDFEDGRVLTSRLNAETKIATARVLAERYLEEDELTPVNAALDTADNLRDDRNFIIHGTWGTLTPEEVPIAASIKAKSAPGTVESQTYPREEMYEIVKKITLARTLLVRTLHALSPSPEK